jgi:SAM-dependent methyltransferase
VDAVITTAPSGDPAEAAELASRFGLHFEERAGRPLQAIPGKTLVLLLAARRADLHQGGKSFRATPGMGVLRALRARKGEPDPLVSAAALRAGERVLDLTLGLGGDALVAAQATGTRLLGIEVSGVLAAFTAAGLRRAPGPAREAAHCIEVVCADHRQFLRAQPDSSFDVVLIDPMFRRAREAGPLFELLRAHAEEGRLESATLLEARRVARRGVLVKDAAPGHELHRLGLEPRLTRRSAAIAFGWADSLVK